MEAAMLYTGFALAPVSAYALAPGAPALAVVVLIALAWSHVRAALEVRTAAP